MGRKKKVEQNPEGAYRVLNSAGDVIGYFDNEENAQSFADEKDGRKVVK